MRARRRRRFPHPVEELPDGGPPLADVAAQQLHRPLDQRPEERPAEREALTVATGPPG
ncbi:hypothetical protein AB0C13_17135 [Streptomyces sp. NPDC049099]|uniref:hypothetical protein n=1 Tax=Streptomyces sp. NPDC049099 TaxID=3155768 RepID=UPI00342AC6B3